MNDKAVALLEQYDIEVLRTRKGRGAYLCDTEQGVLIFKEYEGTQARLALQNRVLQQIAKQGRVKTDSVIATKAGELFVRDKDGVRYILKTYYEGRECNIYDKEECLTAMRLLAQLHNSMEGVCSVPEEVVSLKQTEESEAPKVSEPETTESTELELPRLEIVQSAEPEVPKSQTAQFAEPEIPRSGVTIQNETLAEYEKHNRELIRVRNYLRKKKQKQPFERALYSVMDEYIAQAQAVTGSWKAYVQDLDLTESMDTYYHGNYQYHNIILYEGDWYVINFEKCQPGSPVKDVYLLLRKLLEKSDWPSYLGYELLEAYKEQRSLSAYESIDLYYRLAYPEKFWKIVNFYFSSAKAWIPQRNMEKLQKVLEQEEGKQRFLEEVFQPRFM